VLRTSLSLDDLSSVAFDMMAISTSSLPHAFSRLAMFLNYFEFIPVVEAESCCLLTDNYWTRHATAILAGSAVSAAGRLHMI
jgi:hypothetical protein